MMPINDEKSAFKHVVALTLTSTGQLAVEFPSKIREVYVIYYVSKFFCLSKKISKNETDRN